MSRHVSAELLARFQDGDVSDRRAARIRAHLAGCPACTAMLADLGQVTSLLASVGRPAIPADLAWRLDASLAAAVAERLADPAKQTQTAQPGQTAQPVRPSQSALPGQPEQPERPGQLGPPELIPGRPELPERSSRPSPRPGQRQGRWSSPPLLRGLTAAGVVLVLAGGGLTVARLAAHPSVPSSMASSGSASAASPLPRSVGGAPGAGNAAVGSQGQRKSATPIYAQGMPAAWSMPYSRHGISTRITVLASDVDFEKATLARQIGAELQHATAATKPTPPLAPLDQAAPAELGGWSAGTLRACVARVAGDADVKLVDVAWYQGSRAAVIVTSASPKAAVLRVTVVGPACSATTSAVIVSTTIAAQG